MTKKAAPISIGFFMETAFHYDVYKNIILALLESNNVCYLVINDLMEESFLNDMTTYIKTFPQHKNLGLLRISKMHKEGLAVTCMVSPYYSPILHGRAQFHVRAMYGLAKDVWGHAWWNTFYDSILCYGRYSQERLNIFDTAVVVGNPKFDDWYHHKYDSVLVEALQGDKSRPTVLYAPTYGDLSSVSHWAEKLASLTDDVNLIVKLHHGTRFRQSDSAALALAQRYLSDYLVDGVPTFCLLAAADIVLTDNSGFIFDSIQAGKKTCLLEWSGMKKMIRNNQTLTTLDSAEQKARDYLHTAGDLESLLHVLKSEVKYHRADDEIAHYQKYYCDEFQDGLAGVRAAKVICDLAINNRQTNLYLLSLRQKLFPH